MNKSIYSLVLSDEIVREIDRMAYENGTSRSNMVNQILAESISYTTPEQRMKEIFNEVERLLSGSDSFRIQMQPSDSMLSLRSALTYKYNPTVRYSVELNRSLLPDIGELRVSVRSQSSALRLYMLQFFKLWNALENKYIGNTDCDFDSDRYARKLYLNRNAQSTNQTIGQAITSYIRLFDRALNLYFTNLSIPDAAQEKIESCIQEYLAAEPAIL